MVEGSNRAGAGRNTLRDGKEWWRWLRFPRLTSRRKGLCESPSWLQELATVSDFHGTCDGGGGWTEVAPEARGGDWRRGN
ncbi:uncharacterized protein DS421_11g339580 [Arachis hypogaea]|nr:uncharacterized protein DS421_11g339580 [Arachis hypogaea]